MFIEASNPRIVGDNAYLMSEVLQPATSRCLHFWYHMNGQSIGTLRVWIKYPSSATPKPLWEQIGQKGNQWFEGAVPLSSPKSTFQIIFEGVRGNGYQGDIGIDDITFDAASPCNCKYIYQK